MPRNWRRAGAWSGLAALLLGVVAFAVARPVRVVPRLGPAPPFRLVDQDGQAVTLQDLLGRPVLFGFFPAAPDDPVAARMAQAMLSLQRRLQGEGDGAGELLLVSISLDPERDTPERLKAFSKALGADTDRWRFLTGPGLAVKLAVGSGFGVYYETPPVVYDSRYVLVDATGQVRAAYRGPHLDVDGVLQDLERLRREAAARGAARLVYAAAHWLACYPAR